MVVGMQTIQTKLTKPYKRNVRIMIIYRKRKIRTIQIGLKLMLGFKSTHLNAVTEKNVGGVPTLFLSTYY